MKVRESTPPLTSRQGVCSATQYWPACRASELGGRAKETPTGTPGGMWSTSCPRARHPWRLETPKSLGECLMAKRAAAAGWSLSADAAMPRPRSLRMAKRAASLGLSADAARPKPRSQRMAKRAASWGLSADAARPKPRSQRASCVHSRPSTSQRGCRAVASSAPSQRASCVRVCQRAHEREITCDDLDRPKQYEARRAKDKRTKGMTATDEK